MRGSKPWEPPAPGRNPPPPGPVPKAPSRLISSYCLRFSGSESVSYAELTSLNFSSAALLPGFLSGWFSRASLRNAFLISSCDAFLETPSV